MKDEFNNKSSKTGYFAKNKFLITAIGAVLLVVLIAFGIWYFTKGDQEQEVDVEAAKAGEPQVARFESDDIHRQKATAVGSGAVQSVDVDKKTITIDINGQPTVFNVDDKSTLSKNLTSDAVQLKDIPVGAVVNITYYQDKLGTLWWQEENLEEE